MPEDKTYIYGLNNPTRLHGSWPIRAAEEGGLPTNQPGWTSGPQPLVNPIDKQMSGWAQFGMGVGALGLLGNVAIKPNYRGFDFYGDVARAIEELSPGRVFRTFQISTLLSPLETASQRTRLISPQVLLQMRTSPEGQAWLQQLETLIGKDLREAGVFQFGLRFKKGSLFLGSTERVLLKHAAILRSPVYGGGAFPAGYARSLMGGPFDPEAFLKPVQYTDHLGRITAEPMMFVGGKNRLQHWKRMLFGYGSTLVERINQLARAPFEIEPLATIMRKTPILNRIKFEVASTSGLKALGKITAKLGIFGYASYLAYQQLDYLTRESSMFDDTIMAEGITAGVATGWTRSQLAVSRAAESLGLHKYRERQEEIAPGSTSLQKLAAFPIVGALGALSYGYGKRLVEQARFMGAGVGLPKTSRLFQAVDEQFLSSIYPTAPKLKAQIDVNKIYHTVSASTSQIMSDPKTAKMVSDRVVDTQGSLLGKFAKMVADRQNSGKMGAGLLRAFGKMSPAKVRALLGLGGGLGLILPFLPGALIPDKDPEELEALYSGRQRVPIRKGRWWEFGRTPYEGQRIMYYRQHWYPRMLARGKEKAVYGEDMSPFERWYMENFTYELERRHYFERPYPVTGTAFEDVPFLGPVLAATVGRLFKPAVLMHQEEWLRPGAEGVLETAAMPTKFGYQAIPESLGGELGRGSPVSPYGVEGVLGEQAYRMTEMVGLPGFTMTAIKEAITGEADLFAQEEHLESARRMYGCLKPDTKIRTLKGYKEIQNITTTDCVLTHSGKWAHVNQVIPKSLETVPGNGHLVSIKVSGNFSCLSVTPDHLVLTDQGWKEARNFQVGDFVALPYQEDLEIIDKFYLDAGVSGYKTKHYIYPKASHEYADAYELYELDQKQFYDTVPLNIRSRVLKAVKKGNVYRIPREIPLSREVGFFIGLFLAEGSFCRQSDGTLSGIKLSLHSKERSLAQRALDAMRPWIRGFSFESPKDRPNSLNLYVFGKTLAEFILTFYGEKDRKNLSKHSIYCTKEYRLGVIEGLILGDGHLEKRCNRISFSSVRYELAFGLRDLIHSLGLGYVTISFLDQTSNIRNVRPKWIVRCNGKTSSRIRKVFNWPLVQSEKLIERDNWRESGHLIYVKVVEITTDYSDMVYDLGLDVEEHSFSTSVCIVHNSEREYWDLELGGMLGACFVENTPVVTVDGSVFIQDVKIGDLVLSNEGVYKPVIDLIRQTSSDLINIKARGMGVDFCCTPNHKIPIIRRHRYKGKSEYKHPKPFDKGCYDCLEVAAEDLREGDLLFYPIERFEEEVVIDLKDCAKTYTDKYVYSRASKLFALGYEKLEEWGSVDVSTRKKLRHIGIPDNIAKEVVRQWRTGQQPERWFRHIPVTEDIAYVIGWYIAEGSTDGSHLEYTMNANEAEYANIIKDVFCRLGFNGQLKVENNTLRLRIYSSIMSRYFSLFGTNASTKKIPPKFKRLPKQKLARLVKGLMLGDGWQPTEKWNGGFSSVSSDLVKDLAECLLKFGQIVYITLDYLEQPSGYYPQGTKRKDSTRSYLQVRWNRDQWRLFKNYLLVKITDIEHIKTNCQTVYDLTIEDTHYYTADRVLVHNSELLRRLYPHRRRQIPLYNPIRNLMPEWLPGPGERAPDLWHGDPYAKVQEGELRLPGAGYEALYPELAGVPAEDYPLIHRFAILADVAPYTERFKQTEKEVRAAIRRKAFSDVEIAMYHERMAEVKARRVRKEFTPYKYRKREMTMPEIMLARANEQDQQEQETSWYKEMVGSYWETLAHNIETPAEFLTPMSPGAKLVHMRTALEDYKKTIAYGTTNAFWGHPVRDFFKPFWDSMRHALGGEDLPSQVEELRETEEYFDILKYIKYTSLKRKAEETKDTQSIEEFEDQRRKTLFGIDPYTYKYAHLYGALPRRERDYFKEFVEADAQERLEILEVIPENERRLYLARWQLQDAATLKKAIKKDLLTEEEVENASQMFEEMYRARDTEGMPTSRELWAEYLATRLPRESYADWYRRTYLLQEALGDRALPGPDWVGWHPAVSLQDIKLKIVQDEGRNMFDYDLWPEQARNVARRPIIEEAAAELVNAPVDPSMMRQQVRDIISGSGLSVYQIDVVPTQGPSTINLDIEEDRSNEILNMTRGSLLN